MSDSEIVDKEAIAASKAPDDPNAKTPAYKNKKLIIFLIIVLVMLIPLGGLMVLSYVNKTSTPAPITTP